MHGIGNKRLSIRETATGAGHRGRNQAETPLNHGTIRVYTEQNKG